MVLVDSWRTAHCQLWYAAENSVHKLIAEPAELKAGNKVKWKILSEKEAYLFQQDTKRIWNKTNVVTTDDVFVTVDDKDGETGEPVTPSEVDHDCRFSKYKIYKSHLRRNQKK